MQSFPDVCTPALFLSLLLFLILIDAIGNFFAACYPVRVFPNTTLCCCYTVRSISKKHFILLIVGYADGQRINEVVNIRVSI